MRSPSCKAISTPRLTNKLKKLSKYSSLVSFWNKEVLHNLISQSKIPLKNTLITTMIEKMFFFFSIYRVIKMQPIYNITDALKLGLSWYNGAHTKRSGYISFLDVTLYTLQNYGQIMWPWRIKKRTCYLGNPLLKCERLIHCNWCIITLYSKSIVQIPQQPWPCPNTLSQNRHTLLW